MAIAEDNRRFQGAFSLTGAGMTAMSYNGIIVSLEAPRVATTDSPRPRRAGPWWLRRVLSRLAGRSPK